MRVTSSNIFIGIGLSGNVTLKKRLGRFMILPNLLYVCPEYTALILLRFRHDSSNMI